MPHRGSYDWWRANYATDPDYLAVSAVLAPMGVDCTQVEVDHFPPNAAYTGTSYEHRASYGARPAFPLPKFLHRWQGRGQGGMGGHASTTGSTFVQRGWTTDLRTSMSANNYYAAMNQDIIDKQNVALHVCGNRHLFDTLMRPAVELAVQYGFITQTEAYDIYVNRFGNV